MAHSFKQLSMTPAKLFNNALILLIMAMPLRGWADQLEGIQEFRDGQPALATEVNSNNLILSDKTQDLESRVLRLENTSDRMVRVNQTSGRVSRSAIRENPERTAARESELVELVGGKLILEDIDCTADPYALNRAYIENSRFQNIQFFIKGSCYGDYASLPLGDPDYQGPAFVQEHAQVIGIYEQEGAEAKLIPNPDCRIVLYPGTNCARTGLFASFGGGLYINGVDIDMGPFDNFGVLFSRGAAGDLNNLTITKYANPEGDQNFNWGVGIRIQHAANPYIGSVKIVNNNPAHYGPAINMVNNAAAYVYGYLEITGHGSGIQIDSGASMNVRGVISIDTTENGFGLQLNGGDMQFFSGNDWRDDNGAVNPRLYLRGANTVSQIFGGSRFSMEAPVYVGPGHRFTIEASNVSVLPRNDDGTLTAGNVSNHFYCRGLSTVTLSKLNTDNDGNESVYINPTEIDNGDTCLSTEEWQQWASATFPLPEPE